jgi:hypothetical protein
MKLRLLTLLFVLSGCASAELIKTSVEPRGGTVRYSNAANVRRESREMAMNHINNHCKGGPIKFVSEEFKSEELPVQSDGEPLMPERAKEEAPNMYITFICE